MIHKNLNIDKAILAINAAVKAGIYSTGLFMIGFPTESYEEASATIEFAVLSALHRASFMLVTPFAGTEIAEMAADILKDRNDAYNPRKMTYFTSQLNISAMSDSDLQRVYRLAYRRFYLNPKRLLGLVIHHPQVFSLPRYAFFLMIRNLPFRRRNA